MSSLPSPAEPALEPAREESFILDRGLPGARFDKYLSDRYPAVSRGTLRRLIDEGHIKVNGKPAKATYSPRAGDSVQVHWPEAKPAEAQPQELPLDILFEDKDLVVLNKAPGMVVHPAAGHEDNTLVNALLHHCKGELSGIGGVARPGIVHRLDKETSGCLIVAKNDETHVSLSAQFAKRTAEKFYMAVVCGEVPRESGEIHAAIARHPSHRKRMTVSEASGSARDAFTSYTVQERLLGATVIRAQLHTGRTHQIRVHFQHIGFPVAGDHTYGARQTKRLEELTGYRAPRVLLHAHTLAFTHPGTRRRKKVTAPLPADFLDAVEKLTAPE